MPCLANIRLPITCYMYSSTRDPEDSSSSAATRSSKTRTLPPHLVQSTAGALPRRPAPVPRFQGRPAPWIQRSGGPVPRGTQGLVGSALAEGGAQSTATPREEPRPAGHRALSTEPASRHCLRQGRAANENPSPGTPNPARASQSARRREQHDLHGFQQSPPMRL